MAGVASVAAEEAAVAAGASDARSRFTAADEIAHLRSGHKYRPKAIEFVRQEPYGFVSLKSYKTGIRGHHEFRYSAGHTAVSR